ncbi:MAG TPA: sulfite exporter TauE/SafE family protein, partial [Vicinamibacterales bacterium]|nr:sulfite exporter TauE/SafE family protein [Vicinamibacterales bacterium]
IVGGLAGALLLVRTSNDAFLRLLPWLMLVAAATFTFGQKLRPAPTAAGPSHPFEHGAAWRPALLGVVVMQFLIATYGGYFGGGMGIMMLATMALAGMTNIHEMNGLKSFLGVAINGFALATFIITGKISWQYGLAMAVGATLGGYMTASFARKLDPRSVRWFVIVVGWTMTIYFFVR